MTCALAACASESTTTSSAESSTTATRLPADTLVFRPVLSMCPVGPEYPVPDSCLAVGSPDAEPAAVAVVPQVDAAGTITAYYVLGPVQLDASSLERADASMPQGQWVINPVFRVGPGGIDRFNDAAARCYAKDQTCPTGQLAIVVDDTVVSAPSIQQATFERDQIQISGNFDEASATALAERLNAAGD
jgi:preprotein translocase subunit SecD